MKLTKSENICKDDAINRTIQYLLGQKANVAIDDGVVNLNKDFGASFRKQVDRDVTKDGVDQMLFHSIVNQGGRRIDIDKLSTSILQTSKAETLKNMRILVNLIGRDIDKELKNIEREK